MNLRANKDSQEGFTLIELLVVIAIIGILAGMMLPSLGRAKEMGRKIGCLNNERQLGLSLMMYVDDSGGYLPPRTHPNRWPNRLKSGYKDPKILTCPSDTPLPQKMAFDSADAQQRPLDYVPRSYIYNAFDDLYILQTGDPKWRQLVSTNGFSHKESMIRQPSLTVVFGEKFTESMHWYFDYETYEDITQLDQSRHCKGRRNAQGDGGGGSNYIFADGSARFLKFGRTVMPINMWAVDPVWRSTQIPSS